MPIEFRCSQCQKLLRTGDETAGKQAKCPECGTVMDIPQSSTAGSDAASPFGAPQPGQQPGQGVPADNPFQSGPPPDAPTPGGLPPFGAQPSGSDNPYQSPTGSVPGPSPGLMQQGQIQPSPFDIGDVMGRAWRIFADRMGICIGAALIVGIIGSVPTFISVFFQISDPQLASSLGFAFGMNLFALVWWLITLWLWTGQTILLLKVARGQPAEIGDVFSGGPFYLTTLVAAILFGLAYTAGIFLCVIPGIIVFIMFSQFRFLIIDQRLDVIESLSVSNQITTGNKASLFLLWLVLALISIGVMICTCFIGLLFVVPFGQVMWVVAYLTMTGQPTVEQMQQMQMPPGPQPMA